MSMHYPPYDAPEQDHMDTVGKGSITRPSPNEPVKSNPIAQKLTDINKTLDAIVRNIDDINSKLEPIRILEPTDPNYSTDNEDSSHSDLWYGLDTVYYRLLNIDNSLSLIYREIEL